MQHLNIHVSLQAAGGDQAYSTHIGHHSDMPLPETPLADDDLAEPSAIEQLSHRVIEAFGRMSSAFSVPPPIAEDAEGGLPEGIPAATSGRLAHEESFMDAALHRASVGDTIGVHDIDVQAHLQHMVAPDNGSEHLDA